MEFHIGIIHHHQPFRVYSLTKTSRNFLHKFLDWASLSQVLPANIYLTSFHILSGHLFLLLQASPAASYCACYVLFLLHVLHTSISFPNFFNNNIKFCLLSNPNSDMSTAPQVNSRVIGFCKLWQKAVDLNYTNKAIVL